jgi:phosphoglycolate phosphatase-like HAD superfamily hydrolase
VVLFLNFRTMENNSLQQVFKKASREFGVIFDLDGTLVDTSLSFDETIRHMVLKYSGSPLSDGDLSALREEGGYNDDWVAATELLRRRGIVMTFEAVAKEATELYLQLAPKTEKELFEPQLLEKWKVRFPLTIVTGRNRTEYGVWATRLDPIFDKIYCLHDLPDKKPKPAPDYLLQVVADFELNGGVYIGNGVDDMWAARRAELFAIGVSTTLPREALEQAGAHLVLESVNELEALFNLDSDDSFYSEPSLRTSQSTQRNEDLL